MSDDEPVPPLTPEQLMRPWTTAELRSARSKAQARAKTQLVHEFKERYSQLYFRELRREGLEVIFESRLGTARARVRARELEAVDPDSLGREVAYEPVDPERFAEGEALPGVD